MPDPENGERIAALLSIRYLKYRFDFSEGDIEIYRRRSASEALLPTSSLLHVGTLHITLSRKLLVGANWRLDAYGQENLDVLYEMAAAVSSRFNRPVDVQPLSAEADFRMV